jgi:hypothetical protein
MTNAQTITTQDANQSAAIDRIAASDFEEAFTEYARQRSAIESTVGQPRDSSKGNPLDALDAAFQRMIKLPAPSLDALARKMEATTGEVAENSGWEAQYYVEHFIADARRLANATVAESFVRSSAPSLITTLHARYEELWLAYNTIESAKSALPSDLPARDPGHARLFQLEEAMRQISAEEVAVNEAILHQIPTTWSEALVLAAHLKFAGIEEGSERDGPRQQAIENGFDALLDFLFGEIDHEAVGGQLANVESIVRERRQLRCGQAEAA